MPPPHLKTERLLLRPFCQMDAARVQRYAGSPKIASVTKNIPHPYLDGMAEAWIATHEEDFTTGKSCCFAICLKPQPDDIIGAIGIGIHDAGTRGELGYWLGEPYWNAGYMTEAARALAVYAFGQLGLTRITSHHLTRNPASGRIMQKLGMRLLERREDVPWKNGQRETADFYELPKS